MITLNTLSAPKGANKNTKRIGRGQGSGQGTQAGKGHRGQKARKSGHVRSGFEGNNLPLYMRLPKRGFNNTVFATDVVEVTLKKVAELVPAGVLSVETLKLHGVLKNVKDTSVVKVIGSAEKLPKYTVVGLSSFSKGAKELLSKFGAEFN